MFHLKALPIHLRIYRRITLMVMMEVITSHKTARLGRRLDLNCCFYYSALLLDHNVAFKVIVQSSDYHDQCDA